MDWTFKDETGNEFLVEVRVTKIIQSRRLKEMSDSAKMPLKSMGNNPENGSRVPGGGKTG
jgi:hypothetical protein